MGWLVDRIGRVPGILLGRALLVAAAVVAGSTLLAESWRSRCACTGHRGPGTCRCLTLRSPRLTPTAPGSQQLCSVAPIAA